MKPTYWYNGSMICPRINGYDIVLSKNRWIFRDTERKAKWAATAYKTLVGTTFKNEYDAAANS